MAGDAVNIDAIRAAARRLDGQTRRTPLLSSPRLDEIAGRRILVKPECLQVTGSFKFRGALSALTALPEDVRERGVLAYSSGNHAQGVAEAARRLGVPAVIVMPADAPALKLANTRAMGAEVVLYDRETESREEIGADLAERRGFVLVRPYDEPEVIAGQGTIGLEIAADLPEGVEADVLTCCGGGGLTSGIALALEADASSLRARPVEPEGFDDVTRSLAAGRIERNARAAGSICDAIVTPAPGDLTFPIMQRLCGPGLVVSDAEALRAMALAFLHLKIVVEPGGAVALAAALRGRTEGAGETVVVIASGGNVDPETFSTALAGFHADRP
ncbi:threonine dehydratase [Palleronia aestuarii]|uniref:Threonine dehydratase n=1 Tax=Palleronia aestuarii TaxID=568105 RepID=A0A2W7NIP1_9RHOB|nr:threonine/serine dehydratase [Palleronia aestuarii]PZX19740.1 threonine dehydratase [Palleronia aestuarii]